MAKYRRKPTVIEAERFWPEAKPWPDGVRERQAMNGDFLGEYFVYNELHDSEINLQPGDYVRVDNPKDTYPIDEETFEETYEPVFGAEADDG